MKMMNSLNIDTEKLEYEIEKMRQIEKTLEEVYEQIEKETTTLKDYWESKTADSVQESFIDFYKKVEKSKNNLASDIAFLENAVKERHEEEEKQENKTIDRRFTIVD